MTMASQAIRGSVLLATKSQTPNLNVRISIGNYMKRINVYKIGNMLGVICAALSYALRQQRAYLHHSKIINAPSGTFQASSQPFGTKKGRARQVRALDLRLMKRSGSLVAVSLPWQLFQVQFVQRLLLEYRAVPAR